MANAGLNDRSTSYFNQWTELDLLFTNNETAVGSIIVFGERYTHSWLVDLVAAKGYNTKANASTAGITDGKNGAKKKVSTSGSGQSGKGRSYAITVKNDTLKAHMAKLTFSKLFHDTNDPDLAGVVKDIYDTLDAYVLSDPTGTLHYFTALTLSGMMVDSQSYTNELGKFKLANDAINVAKDNFDTISIPAMEETITFFEGFLNDLDLVYPDFVKAMRKILKKLDVLGKLNQGVQATMYAGTPDEVMGLGGLMAVTNYPPVKKAKIDKTNSMGGFPIMNMRVGKWIIKFSCPGYVTQTITVIVKARRKVTLNVVMMPIVVTPIPTV